MKSFFGGSKSQPAARKPTAPVDRNNPQRKRNQEEDQDDQAVDRWDSDQNQAAEDSDEEDDRPGKSENRAGQNQRRNGKPHPKFPGSLAARKAMEHLAQLTGQTPESISGLTPTDEGWKVTLDVVELERIPRTTDVMASYEVELDGEGELTGYRRLTRFYRNQVDEQ